MGLGLVGRSWLALEKTVAEVYANRLLSPLPILAIALAIVITGVLAFRLHAFLTLIVAALAVAALTPASAIERYELSKDGVRIDQLEPGNRGCPYHLHHAQEELFIVLEGQGTLRVAG